MFLLQQQSNRRSNKSTLQVEAAGSFIDVEITTATSKWQLAISKWQVEHRSRVKTSNQQLTLTMSSKFQGFMYYYNSIYAFGYSLLLVNLSHSH